MVSNFNHSQLVATMGCLLHTHTTLLFLVWFCTIFAKFRIFSLSQNQWSFGKKRPKSPSKKLLVYLYMVQVSSQKYIWMFNFFLPSFNSQIWLNRLMDDPHLSYITKLTKDNSSGHTPKKLSKEKYPQLFELKKTDFWPIQRNKNAMGPPNIWS